MILIIKIRADEKTLKHVAQDLKGYIKVVVDVDKKILAAGGLKHVDAEQLLLENGSQQEHLWGGGLDLDTLEIDFDSMINLRPNQQNTSREVLDQNIRKTIEKIIRDLLR